MYYSGELEEIKRMISERVIDGYKGSINIAYTVLPKAIHEYERMKDLLHAETERREEAEKLRDFYCQYIETIKNARKHKKSKDLK